MARGGAIVAATSSLRTLPRAFTPPAVAGRGRPCVAPSEEAHKCRAAGRPAVDPPDERRSLRRARAPRAGGQRHFPSGRFRRVTRCRLRYPTTPSEYQARPPERTNVRLRFRCPWSRFPPPLFVVGGLTRQHVVWSLPAHAPEFVRRRPHLRFGCNDLANRRQRARHEKPASGAGSRSATNDLRIRDVYHWCRKWDSNPHCISTNGF